MELTAFFREKSHGRPPCAPYHGELFGRAKSRGIIAACFLLLVTVVGKDVG